MPCSFVHGIRTRKTLTVRDTLSNRFTERVIVCGKLHTHPPLIRKVARSSADWKPVIFFRFSVHVVKVADEYLTSLFFNKQILRLSLVPEIGYQKVC